jgi:hypothetical protein
MLSMQLPIGYVVAVANHAIIGIYVCRFAGGQGIRSSSPNSINTVAEGNMLMKQFLQNLIVTVVGWYGTIGLMYLTGSHAINNTLLVNLPIWLLPMMAIIMTVMRRFWRWSSQADKNDR